MKLSFVLLSFFVIATQSVACTQHEVRTVSMADAIVRYACATRAGADRVTPKTGEAAVDDVTLEMNVALGQEGDVGGGEVVPVASGAKDAGSQSGTVRVKLKQLPTAEECAKLTKQSASVYELDPETSKIRRVR